MPTPGGLDDPIELFEAWLPAEFPFYLRGAGHQASRITGPSSGSECLDRRSGYRFRHIDDLLDGVLVTIA